jgi:hypothetical protein
VSCGQRSSSKNAKKEEFSGLCAVAGLTLCNYVPGDVGRVMGSVRCFRGVLSVEEKLSSMDRNVARDSFCIGFAAAFYLLSTVYPTSAAEPQPAPAPLPPVARTAWVPMTAAAAPPAVPPDCLGCFYVLPHPAPATVVPSYRMYDNSIALVEAAPTKTFGGVTFGVGFGVTFDVQHQQRVASATAVNGIVRVTDSSSNVFASLVAESHYFFVPEADFVLGNAAVPAKTWGHGPFVAIDGTSANNNTIIAGFSVGWMIGFRQPRGPTAVNPYTLAKEAPYDNNSWNIGLGFRVDPKAQVLGDGVVANMPLPPGETTVRLKTVPRYGVMLLTSYGF